MTDFWDHLLAMNAARKIILNSIQDFQHNFRRPLPLKTKQLLALKVALEVEQ